METTVNINQSEMPEEMKEKNRMSLMWIGIVSIIMFFAGLTSAYVVSSSSAKWKHFELPSVFYMSSAIILLSSASLHWALVSAKKNQQSNIVSGLALTFVLSIAFIISQCYGYLVLREHGIYAAGTQSNASGSYLYVISFLHIAHLFAGIIALSVTFIMGVKKKYNSQNTAGIKLCALYWHFLTVLWIYLFLFFLFIR